MKPDLNFPPPPFPDGHPDNDLRVVWEAPEGRAFALEDLRNLAGYALTEDIDLSGVATTTAELVCGLLEEWGFALEPAAHYGQAGQRTGVFLGACLDDHPGVMELPLGRADRHRIYPMPGDVLQMRDLTWGIVTAAMCRGCRHFRIASLTPAQALNVGIESEVRWGEWEARLPHVRRGWRILAKGLRREADNGEAAAGQRATTAGEAMERADEEAEARRASERRAS